MYGRCTVSDNSGCYRDATNGNMVPTMSARLHTRTKFNFRFGRVEIRAKMPVGDWLWPGIATSITQLCGNSETSDL